MFGEIAQKQTTPSTVGRSFFVTANPSAVTFPQVNADNSVSYLSASAFRTAIGAGTGGGSVTSVDGSGGSTGLTLTGGPITTSGTLTIGGTLALASGGTAASLTDPGANTLMGWDDTDNAVSFFPIGSGLTYTHGTHTLSAVVTGLANPTASVGLSTVNGSATTAMRSDGAPALSQSIAPSWTGFHNWTVNTTIATGSFTGWNGFAINASTLTLTGAGGPINGVTSPIEISQPTITSSSAVTITNASTVHIHGAPLTGGSITFTNSYALYVEAGTSGFGGAIKCFSNGTFDGTLRTGKASSTTGSIDFVGTTSGTVTLSVADAAGTWTMKLPTSAGTNTYVLTTDGFGNCSWVAPTSGVSSITAGTGLTGGTITTSGTIALDTTIPQAESIIVTNTATNTSTAVLTLGHSTSATAANNFGLLVNYELDSTTTPLQMAARDQIAWTVAADATRRARRTMNVYDTSSRECIQMEASGTDATICFLGGISPAPRQTGDAGTALVTFGFMSGTPTFACANLTGTISTSQIGAAQVTLAKIQNATANSKLLGSGSTGSGASYSEITLGTGLSMSGTTLSATGGSGTVTSVASADNSVTVTNGTTTPDLALNKNWFGGCALVNGYISESHTGNAATFAIKNIDTAGDPSSTHPVFVMFRNATAATGDYTIITLTAATSFTISSGSTMGTANGIAFRLWLVGFNDAGTFRIGAVNCLSGTSIYPLRDEILASSTAEGGAGGADSAQVIYTGTAVTSKAMRILAYATYSSGLATAGTWNASPSKIQGFSIGIAMPGEPVGNISYVRDGAVATGTTTIPSDDTIPQSSEGTQFMTTSITPTSSANVLWVDHNGTYSHSAVVNVGLALFRDSGTDAVAANLGSEAGNAGLLLIHYEVLAGSTSSTTFNIRAGSPSAGTLTFNGVSSARRYGGVMASYIKVQEIMA